jgi:hypothetical protein
MQAKTLALTWTWPQVCPGIVFAELRTGPSARTPGLTTTAASWYAGVDRCAVAGNRQQTSTGGPHELA